MVDLDPHQPATSRLEIIGTSNPHERYIRAATPLSETKTAESVEQNEVAQENDTDLLADHPDVYSPPLFGPCIKFAGQVLHWTGNSYNNIGRQAADARVGFETYAGCRASSILEIVNLGTTALYFKWKMLPKSNPFDLVNANVQRFYFDTSNGVILPGETLNFPFVFKSEKAGVFTEQWQFETHPSLVGGASLIVTLRGIALREDSFKQQREQLESTLQRKIVWKNVRRIVDEIVDSMKEPERPKSPLDSYLTEQEIFKRQNPHLHYQHHIVERLKELYKVFIQPPTMDGTEDGREWDEDELKENLEWDLNIADFKRCILELDDEDERKTAFLENINETVIQLSFPTYTPRLRDMYQSCYQYLLNAIDNLSGQSIYLRNLLGLPEKETEEQIDESRSEVESADSPLVEQNYSRQKSLSAERLYTPPDLNRVVPKVPEQKGAKPTPTKSTPKAGAKEEKKSGKADGKKDTKKEAQAKKADRASPTKKTPPAKTSGPSSVPQVAGTEGRLTPGPDGSRGRSQSQLGSDPLLERKYTEKLYSQVYMDLNHMVLNLVGVLEDINGKHQQTECS